MGILRALIFNVFLHLWTVTMAILSLPTWLFSPVIVFRSAQVWAWGVMKLAEIFLGVGAEVRGREYLRERRVVFASKHQSSWETVKLSTLINQPSIVIKQELAQMPVYGYYFRRAGMIPIDRNKGISAIRGLIKMSKRRLGEGRSIMIYPEGTRTAIGEKPHYFPGIAALYSELDVPVVPIALNSALYWRRGSFTKIPGRIIIEALPPIPPGLDRKAFLAELEDRIETATARLVEEGRADLRGRGYDPG